MEDVLASLVPVELTTGNKRKISPTLVEDEPSKPSPKRLRVNENIDCPDAEISCLDSPQQKDIILQKDIDVTVCTETASLTLDMPDHLQHLSEDLNTDNKQALPSYNNTLISDIYETCNQDDSVALDGNHTLQGVAIFPIENNTSLPQKQNETTVTTEVFSLPEDTSCSEIQSETKDLSSSKIDSEKLVSAPTELFWSNRDNLCWLDSLLVALVNFRSLRKLKPTDEPQQSPVWRVLMGYDEACAAVQAPHRTDGDGSLKIPNHMLHKVNKDLETLRMSVFSLLQPMLQCNLGQKETPVFALPLLLKRDSWLEPLFRASFHWDFKCTECKSTTKENVVKTLSTFTNIVPDWHPLRAVHLASCNVCCRKNQRRRMVLEQVPSVFTLHFVEGLPDNNIQIYSFTFNRKHYSVTAIIQYNNRLKHFVTWICKSDGSWVEFDDLKHPHCKVHKTLPVPAQEIHVVFWEEEEHQDSRACSPSSTFTECPLSTNEINRTVTDLDLTEDLLQGTPDQSLLNAQSETNVVVTAGVDTAIGSTTLLGGFEGLSHDDVITLTLVEMKEDSKTQPSNGNDGQSDQTVDLKGPNSNSVIQDLPQVSCTAAPDSSSTVETIETPEELFSESEPDDDSRDPTFVPETRRRQSKRRVAAAKRANRSKVENAPKRNVNRKVTKKACVSAVQSEPTPATTTQPPSLVSSTIFVPQIVTQQPPAVQTQQQQNGWAVLLQRSYGHIQKSTAKISPTQTPTPIAEVKPIGPVYSTPKPHKVLVSTKAPLQPLLRKNNAALPLKEAEMYGAFGSTNSKAPTVNQNIPKQKTANTVLNSSLMTVAEVKLEIPSKKNKSSNIPPGLSETEALRYKLMKKLKAKKKKLAKLDELLGQRGNGIIRPDSTNLNSPNSVTSSTFNTSSAFDSSTCDEFLSDLLSPATTASTLSPDSTGFLEMFAKGQEVATCEAMQTNSVVPLHNRPTAAETDNFLDEFISQAVAEQPTEMETEALSALDLFF